MNAKDKAIELIDKMYSVDDYDDYNAPAMQYEHARKCALIAVDELIKECWDHREIDLQAGYDYWISVKQEIEKL